jgi:hypothetical protein
MPADRVGNGQFSAVFCGLEILSESTEPRRFGASPAAANVSLQTLLEQPLGRILPVVSAAIAWLPSRGI